MRGAGRKKRNEALSGAVCAFFCCTVMACSEASVVATPAGAGRGGSGGVSGSGGSGGSGSGGSAGAAAGSSGAGGSADPLDASTDAADAMPFCCTPSPQPDCCMYYGGTRRSDDSCGIICDNMPLPSAPWQLGVDPNGCPVWIEPPQTNQCCGCPPEDGGI